MRLVQLAGLPGGTPLSFHPRLTVIGGLDDDVRARLLTALRALPAGDDPGLSGLVEAHGVVLDLHADTLRLLGMTSGADVVVAAADLPRDGESPRLATSDAGSGGPDPLAGLRLSHEILAHGVAALKRTRIEFEDARLQAVEAIEEARGDLDPFASTAFEQAAAALRRAEELVGDGGSTPVAAETDSLEDLEAERDRLLAAIEELGAVEVEEVRDALHRAERRSQGDGIDPVAVDALATELEAAERAVAELDSRRRDAGRDPADLVRRIEGARLALERLETSSAPPPVSDEDRQELEAAHDAVVEADAKVSASRIGGKAARQQLDEAVAAEQAVLDRLGFPTYSAFALAQSAPGPDPETRVELEETRRELAELEAAYHEALTVGEADPERAEAEARRAQLREDARVLVEGHDEEQVAALRALAERIRAEDAGARAVADLRRALAEQGVDFGDLDLADDEVIEVARVWLSDVGALVEQRSALERELDTVQARLLVVAPALAQGEAADPVARAQADVEAAEARLAAHRQASDRVAELCGLLEEIEQRLADLGENIEAQESLVAAASDGLAATEDQLAAAGEGEGPVAVEELFGVPEGVDDTEWYLLTRLAGLRALSYAGSVPLVLDGALADLDRERAHRVLDKVEAMTDVVQVVYLGDDDAVVEWAAFRGPEAAVITVGGEGVEPGADLDVVAQPVG